ncbi:MAG: Ulp1 family isopeptidase, partial [Bacteroidota bacterium]
LVKDAWDFLLPVLSIDGCHLTNSLLRGGSLLLVGGMDIQKRYHLLAFAVVNSESESSINALLNFIVEKVKDAKESLSVSWICDRGKAIEAVNFSHFFDRPNFKIHCAQHLFRNVVNNAGKFDDSEKAEFFKCIASNTQSSFNRSFSKIGERHRNYLRSIPREKWAVYASPLPRFNVLTNNICESLNSAFKRNGIRDLSAPEILVSLIKWQSERYDRFFAEVKDRSEKLLGYPLLIQEKSAEYARFSFCRCLSLEPSKMLGEWYVTTPGKVDVLVCLSPDKEDVTHCVIQCECAFFRANRWWCSHVHTVFNMAGPHRQHFLQWMMRPKWARTDVMRHALCGPWRIPTLGAINGDPNTNCEGPQGWAPLSRGRPQKRRIPSEGEDQKTKRRKEKGKFNIQQMMKPQLKKGRDKLRRIQKFLHIGDGTNSDSQMILEVGEEEQIDISTDISFEAYFNEAERTFTGFPSWLFLANSGLPLTLNYSGILLLEWIRREPTNVCSGIHPYRISRTSMAGILGPLYKLDQNVRDFWLSDEIINEYTYLICRRQTASKVAFISSHVRIFEGLSPELEASFVKRGLVESGYFSIFDLDMLVLPVCLDNSHWVLYLVYPSKRKILYLDSLLQEREHSEEKTEVLLDFLGRCEKYLRELSVHLPPPPDCRWLLSTSLCQQQTNSFDCGLYLLMFVETACMELEQEQIREPRTRSRYRYNPFANLTNLENGNSFATRLSIASALTDAGVTPCLPTIFSSTLGNTPIDLDGASLWRQQ